jgi:hypothetical protein
VIFAYFTEGEHDDLVVAAFDSRAAAESFAVDFINRRWGEDLAPHLHKYNELNRLVSNSIMLSIYEEAFDDLAIREGFWFQEIPVNPDFETFKHPLLPEERKS